MSCRKMSPYMQLILAGFCLVTLSIHPLQRYWFPRRHGKAEGQDRSGDAAVPAAPSNPTGRHGHPASLIPLSPSLLPEGPLQ